MLANVKKDVIIRNNRDKILVVTHAKTLRALMATSLAPEENCPVPNYVDGELVGAHNPKNCEIIPFHVEES